MCYIVCTLTQNFHVFHMWFTCKIPHVINSKPMFSHVIFGIRKCHIGNFPYDYSHLKFCSIFFWSPWFLMRSQWLFEHSLVCNMFWSGCFHEFFPTFGFQHFGRDKARCGFIVFTILEVYWASQICFLFANFEKFKALVL